MHFFWKKNQQEEALDHLAEDELPVFSPGMVFEVLSTKNHLLFKAIVNEVHGNSLTLVDCEGNDTPYVEYNTRIKLRGYYESSPITLYGMICGSTSNFWKVDRLATLQTSERRNFFRQIVSTEASARLLEIIPPDECVTDSAEPDYRVIQSMPCRLLDISASGAMFIGKIKWEEGEHILLDQINLISTYDMFSFHGVIRRVIKREEFYEYGCEFLDLEDDVQEHLIQTILALQRQELQSKRQEHSLY